MIANHCMICHTCLKPEANKFKVGNPDQLFIARFAAIGNDRLDVGPDMPTQRLETLPGFYGHAKALQRPGHQHNCSNSILNLKNTLVHNLFHPTRINNTF